MPELITIAILDCVGLITSASEFRVGENRWVRFLWFKGGVRNCMWSLKLRTQVQILPCSKSLKMLYPKYTPIKTGSYISWLSKSVLSTIRFTDEIDKDYKFYDMKLSSSLNGWIKCFDDWKLYIHKLIYFASFQYL